MRRLLAPALAAFVLAACVSTPPHRPPPPAPPPPAPPPGLALDSLPGWAEEDHLAALVAWKAACAAQAKPDAACAEAVDIASTGPAAREFLERRFRAFRVEGDGLLTAYFAPEYEARMSRQGEFTAVIRPKPDDLVVVDGGLLDPALAGQPTPARAKRGGGYEPYPDRAAIEAKDEAKPLGWMRPEDLFFLQIQGSGVLDLPDGRRVRAAFAASNGRPFVGIAKPMRDQGLLAENQTSGEAIRQWLADHRGPEADAVMRLNPRYAFFVIQPYDGTEPKGAAGVPLPAGRAVAVDPAFHTYGELMWIDASAPALAGAFPRYRRAVAALDTGGAIKGPVRADLYLGTGAAAGTEAGRVKHALSMWRLIPVSPP